MHKTKHSKDILFKYLYAMPADVEDPTSPFSEVPGVCNQFSCLPFPIPPGQTFKIVYFKIVLSLFFTS